MSKQYIVPKEQTLQGRVALITGASRGIGAATARLFAAHGALVGVNYHQSEQEALQIVQEIEAIGGNALAVQASVDDPQQVATMVKRVEEELGPIHDQVPAWVAKYQAFFSQMGLTIQQAAVVTPVALRVRPLTMIAHF